MIYGALGDIEEYRGMLKGLDVLIDWLEENDPAQLEVGSHPILGDKVFANVMAPTTRPEAEAHYETHQRYHDLQIDIEGREAFKVATGSLTLVQEFDEKDDYDLVDSDASIAGDLADDKFALFVAGSLEAAARLEQCTHHARLHVVAGAVAYPLTERIK